MLLADVAGTVILARIYPKDDYLVAALFALWTTIFIWLMKGFYLFLKTGAVAAGEEDISFNPLGKRAWCAASGSPVFANSVNLQLVEKVSSLLIVCNFELDIVSRLLDFTLEKV